MWNSHSRCMWQGHSIPDGFDMSCIPACVIPGVSRTTLGCSLHFDWVVPALSVLFCHTGVWPGDSNVTASLQNCLGLC